jgi:hypothetical protein
MTEIPCAVCGKPIQGLSVKPTAVARLTCSESCYERFVNFLIFKYGPYKKVGRARTGEIFRVPLREIIERDGINEQDLDQYPRWEDK